MWKSIKREWDNNPLNVLMVGATVATSAVIVLNAVSSARSRNAYSRQVNYRLNNG